MRAPAPLQVVIVDDEPLARRRLERLVAREPDLVLLGSYAHGLEARAAMPPEVDLLLLDIEMPFEGGFDMLQALPEGRCRAVIVVTAHARHALPAIRHQAIDLLLKPYDDESFHQAVARARRRLLADALLRAVGRASAPPSPAPGPPLPTRLRIPAGEADLVLDPSTIAWLRAQDKSVLISSAGRSFRVTGRLGDFERRLAPHGFVRIHRSTLVNLSFVAALRRQGHGDATVVLSDGSELDMSRHFSQRLDGLLL